MITIFSNPRPFTGPFAVIQKNAVKSWIKNCPGCKIILFEDEEGTTSSIAKEFGVKCITDVKKNEFGTALLDSVFNKVKNESESGIIVQINSDIILTSDFLPGIQKIRKIMGEKPFFMTGRRWNLDIKEEISYKEADWEEKIRKKIKEEGKLHRFSGMDYWIFSGYVNFSPPPFSIGRCGMDSWLVYNFRKNKIPVIDSTEVITIIHQNHNYPSKKKPYFKIEKDRNLRLAGGFANVFTLREADWILKDNGLVRPEFPRIIFSRLAMVYPWRLALALKRRIYEKLG